MNKLATSEKALVIVESPAKATTIGRYLGAHYDVLASYGHVRDLMEKDGAVDPDNHFAMTWEVQVAGKKRIKEIAAALKNVDALYLATDPDREGEAIAWHLHSELENQGKLKDKTVKRIVFNEITKSAILQAIEQPRDLDRDLVDAYLARRGLDFLVGYRLSPILWRKMPGSRSAGRVQSVALRMISEREEEIEDFESQEYWQVQANFSTAKGETFPARLVELRGEKLEKFSLSSEADAEAALAECRGKQYHIQEQTSREETRRPAPPFTTSTLQQEASRKLYFSTSQTMQLAQKLYEGIDSMEGLITYMRTDSTSIAQEAVHAVRGTIQQQFGQDYLPDKPRQFKTKAKNSQEAHEAIRPTDPSRTPQSLAGKIDPAMLKLYELVWKRTMASQMAEARIQRVRLTIPADDQRAAFRASGQSILFPGFLKLYEVSVPQQEKDAGDETRALPLTKEGERLEQTDCSSSQHFTQPPPRYSEAALVKQMEEIGIGRPSTYASTLKLLQDRGYVRLEQRRFHPEDRGRLVIHFLNGFFTRYIDYDFTAKLEAQLDAISSGERHWIDVMNDFWHPFWKNIQSASELSNTEVRDYIDRTLGQQYFRARDGKTESELRQCPACAEGVLHVNFSRHGMFIGCSRYPDCRFVRQTSGEAELEGEYPQNLGTDPQTQEDVLLCKGPYGFYVQLGHPPTAETGKKKPAKPKRTSLLKGMTPNDVDLSTALKLLSLPRLVGEHPETGAEIKAGVGRYGPYLLTEGKFTTLPAADSVLDIGLNRALAVLAEKKPGSKKTTPGRGLGNHPDDDKPVTVKDGRYGFYVQHGKVNATIPKDRDPAQITLEEALPLLAARLEKIRQKAKK